MKLEFHTHGLTLTHTVREHVARRLSFALSGALEHVRRVSVRLSDINGPRGGKDKTCQIHVTLDGCADVIIEHTEVELHAAVDRAADRVAQNVARQVEKKREQSKRPKWRYTMDDAEAAS